MNNSQVIRAAGQAGNKGNPSPYQSITRIWYIFHKSRARHQLVLSRTRESIQERTAGAHTGRLEKFSLTATQAILYFNALAPHQDVALKLRLRAKYPIRAHTFQSRLYEYYDPDVNSIARPVKLDVDGR